MLTSPGWAELRIPCAVPSNTLVKTLLMLFCLVLLRTLHFFEYSFSSSNLWFRPWEVARHFGFDCILHCPYPEKIATRKQQAFDFQRQKLDYCVFVVEQFDNGMFNKARVMNAGFMLINNLTDFKANKKRFHCYIFHDVDLFVENDRNMYMCGDFPKHLSSGISIIS